MMDLAFFDTNILLYTDDGSAPAKQRTAIDLYVRHRTAGTAVLSVQVLQEYFAAATRKLGVDAETAQRKVELLARGRMVRLKEDDVIAAIELHRLTRLSFWDALIVRPRGAPGRGGPHLQRGLAARVDGWRNPRGESVPVGSGCVSGRA